MLLNSLFRSPRMNLDLQTLFKNVDAIHTPGIRSVRISAISTDSRRVAPGALFFAMPGQRTDGSYYVEEAIDRGAAAIVSQGPAGRLPGHVAHVQVPDVRKALAEVSQSFFGHPERALDLIGVSGTNGKTTVTTLCKHLLERPGSPVGLLGTVSYELGQRSLPAARTTPESSELCHLFDQMRRAGCQKAVLEVSSHGIDQHRVWKAPFKVAAFLNLTQDHIDYHGTMDAYFEVKARLFTGETGHTPETAVINLDDPYGRRLLGLLPDGVRAVTFGEDAAAMFRAVDVDLSATGASFTLVHPEGRSRVESPLLGAYNVSNVLAALAIVHAVGMDLEEAMARLRAFGGVPGRMERIDCGQDFNVLVDYAHTPDALKNALTMLGPITPGRVLVVFGCGGNRDRLKRPLMTRAVQLHASEAWATADNPRGESLQAIFDDMRTGITNADKIHFVEDRRRAIHLAISAARAGDAVLIAGKGHESYQEFADTVAPFDDRQVARELLRLRSGKLN